MKAGQLVDKNPFSYFFFILFVVCWMSNQPTAGVVFLVIWLACD